MLWEILKMSLPNMLILVVMGGAAFLYFYDKEKNNPPALPAVKYTIVLLVLTIMVVDVWASWKFKSDRLKWEERLKQIEINSHRK